MTGTADAAEPPQSAAPRTRSGWRRRGSVASAEVQHGGSVGPSATELDSRARSERSEVEFDDQVRAVLVQIDAQEQQARAAQPDVDRLPGWPSWSMDTGLTEAQERFVEAWSPQRVLHASRSVRQLVLILQHWIRTHRDEADLDEALTILATFHSPETRRASRPSRSAHTRTDTDS
jgi:hypothetical protein